MRRFYRLVSWCLVVLSGMAGGSAMALQEPMQALTGYGSDQFDHCSGSCSSRFDLEDVKSPERVSYFVPKVLKNGTSAPVIIYMHGFFAPVPEIYQDHIDHLTRQGNIVIFPQYHAAGWDLMKEMGVFAPADQNEWLRHAVKATHHVLDVLGPMADRSEVYAFGHSIGGLLLLGWSHVGGPQLNGMLLANPKLDLKAGIPEFVHRFIHVKELPWMDYAQSVRGRIMILGGQDDYIALVSELRAISHYITNAASVVMYVAGSDHHNGDAVWADHLAAASNSGMLKMFSWMRRGKSGGKIVLDTMDFRYYWAALDALIDGKKEYNFDMGSWSDGVPFVKVTKAYQAN